MVNPKRRSAQRPKISGISGPSAKTGRMTGREILSTRSCRSVGPSVRCCATPLRGLRGAGIIEVDSRSATRPALMIWIR